MVPGKHKTILTENTNLLGTHTSGCAAKALLSQIDDEKLNFYIESIEKVRLAEPSIEKRRLVDELKQVRKQNYAISHGEVILGAVGISAPIKNYVCPAALTILGTETDLGSSLTDLIEELKASAQRISMYIAKMFLV